MHKIFITDPLRSSYISNIFLGLLIEGIFMYDIYKIWKKNAKENDDTKFLLKAFVAQLVAGGLLEIGRYIGTQEGLISGRQNTLDGLVATGYLDKNDAGHISCLKHKAYREYLAKKKKMSSTQ